MARRKIVDTADAERCLRAASSAGLGRTEWARDNGIDARSLHAWWMALEKRKRADAQDGPELRLVELVPLDVRQDDRPVYVVRCGNLSVEVDERFDEATLSRLLAVVSSC
jgi:transposase-like protein